jgi:6-phosphofructokinase
VKGTIAILTGGGDVPGLNPAIRSITIRALREGYRVIGIRRGWGGLVDLDRNAGADNSLNYQVLTEDVVNRAGRTGGTFLHTSRTRPSHMPLPVVPPQYQDGYRDEYNDLTPEVLKNLEFLGVDYLIPIGGDDTLSYAQRMHEEGVNVVAIPKTMDNDVPGHGLLHRVQHVRDANDRADASAADVGGLTRAVPGHRGIRQVRGVHGAAADHGRRGGPLHHPGASVRHGAAG